MKKKNNSLSDLEWTTCWMAIRYAMNGQTISCASLPALIIEGYYNRLSEQQKKTIAEDLARNEEEVKRYTDGKSLAFGNPNIDRPTWLKFWKAFDVDSHYKIKLIDDTEAVVFEANGRIYPLNEYINCAYSEIYLPNENIKEKI